VSGRGQRFAAGGYPPSAVLHDLVSGGRHLIGPDGAFDIPVEPYGVRWLKLG
jgi:hypothetical protein